MTKPSSPPDTNVLHPNPSGINRPVATEFAEIGDYIVNQSLAYLVATEAVDRVSYPLNSFRSEIGQRAWG